MLINTDHTAPTRLNYVRIACRSCWYISIYIYRYGARTVVESTQAPGEVVALTRYRGLQFSYFRQGESPPRVSVEMRARVRLIEQGSRLFRLGLSDRGPQFVGKILR